MKKIHFPLTIIVALFITGNQIGAGVLGLPVQTGLAGFMPSILGIIFISVCIFLTSLVLGQEAVRSQSETFYYPFKIAVRDRESYANRHLARAPGA